MHAYPAQLADFVLDHWPEGEKLTIGRRALRELISTCFQASLAQEEGRPVRFRTVAAKPEELAALTRDEDLLQLEFTEPQPLTPDTARRLSPAAPFHASSIGVRLVADQWQIWGLGHTGPAWLGPTWDARPEPDDARGVLMVHVLGAGRIAVYAGRRLVASLERGVIEATTTDVFGFRLALRTLPQRPQRHQRRHPATRRFTARRRHLRAPRLATHGPPRHLPHPLGGPRRPPPLRRALPPQRLQRRQQPTQTQVLIPRR
ncbi:MAG: hypothetical protein QM756_36025 [Polyangiaceae bacterium]